MKIWIIGAPGSGKSFLGRQLGAELSLPHTELDSIYWRPKWTIKDTALFAKDVHSIAVTPYWIIDRNSTAAEPILQETADILIWLRPNFLRSYSRVLLRTYHRVATQEPICSIGMYNQDICFVSI